MNVVKNENRICVCHLESTKNSNTIFPFSARTWAHFCKHIGLWREVEGTVEQMVAAGIDLLTARLEGYHLACFTHFTAPFGIERAREKLELEKAMAERERNKKERAEKARAERELAEKAWAEWEKAAAENSKAAREVELGRAEKARAEQERAKAEKEKARKERAVRAKARAEKDAVVKAESANENVRKDSFAEKESCNLTETEEMPVATGVKTEKFAASRQSTLDISAVSDAELHECNAASNDGLNGMSPPSPDIFTINIAAIVPSSFSDKPSRNQNDVNESISAAEDIKIMAAAAVSLCVICRGPKICIDPATRRKMRERVVLCEDSCSRRLRRAAENRKDAELLGRIAEWTAKSGSALKCHKSCHFGYVADNKRFKAAAARPIDVNLGSQQQTWMKECKTSVSNMLLN